MRRHLLPASVRLTLASLLLASAAAAQIVSLSPKRLVFPPQVVGVTSATKKVTLQNTDAVNSLTITSVTASGDFTSTNTCDGTVAALATCTISINFAPTETGTIDGAITIIDNAPNSPHIIGLSGTGLGQVTMSPASLNFGTVAIGGNSTLSVKVTNNTTSTVNNLTFAPSGDYSAAPGSTSPCGGSLSSKSSCNENITFAPTQTGSVNGAVVITDSAANSPQVASLVGTGAGSNGAPITFTPPTLSFGKVLVDSTSASQTLTVNNTAEGSLAITATASGDYSEAPGGATPCGANLNGLSSCTLSVTFSPAAVGSINGSVSVSYSGTDSPQLATLTGTGLAQVTTSKTAFAFAGQQVGTTSASSTVKLTNNTNATVAISSTTPSGNFAVLTGKAGDCGSSLAANQSCNIRAAFSPTHSGYLQGSITVSDGGSNSPQIVNLTGTGLGTPQFLYVNGSGAIGLFSISLANGQLTNDGVAASPSGEAILGLDPTARFLFESGGAGLYAYTVNGATGALTSVSGSPFSAGAAFGVAVDPSGRFVYVGDNASTDLYAFAINLATGALASISGSPFTVGSGPQGVVADPTGRFLYVVAPNGVSAFTINAATGALTGIKGSPFAADSNAYLAAIDPAGKFLYVGNNVSNTVSAFVINPTSGALTAVKGSPFACAADCNGMKVDLLGRFLYASNFDNDTISAYAINGGTGALTPIMGSPFAGGSSGIFIDPSNKFLFASDYYGDVIWAWDVNQSTGALTEFEEVTGLGFGEPGNYVATGFVP